MEFVADEDFDESDVEDIEDLEMPSEEEELTEDEEEVVKKKKAHVEIEYEMDKPSTSKLLA